MPWKHVVELCIAANLLTWCIGVKLQSNYAVGTFDLSIQDPNQPGHTTKGSVFYPLNATNVKFPLLVMSPGFIGSESFYSFLWKYLVPLGYIMAIEASYDYDPYSDPLWKAREQAYLLDYVREQGNNPKSPLYNIVGDTATAMGHSEGGVASFIAADATALGGKYNYSFTSLMILSGCFTALDDYTESIKRDTIPVFILTGTNDCICLPSKQQVYFTESPSSCKYFASIVNATHCRFAHPSTVETDLCVSMEFVNGCAFETHLSFDQQLGLINKYALPWLDFTLKGDADAKKKFELYLKDDSSSSIVVDLAIKCD